MTFCVMVVPGTTIHGFFAVVDAQKNVDARAKPEHDEGKAFP